MARPQAVLFDLDHTLFDTDRAEARALRASLAELGLPFGPRLLAAYRRINGELWDRYRRGQIAGSALSTERFRRLLREHGAPARQARTLSCLYLHRLSGRGDLLPGCRRGLARLGARYRLGVVTNGYDHVQRSRLSAARLETFFEVVVTSEGAGVAKPDPRILRVALDALGVSPEKALYVGDDLLSDAGAARAAGVPFCWLDRGQPLPAGVGRPPRRVSSLTQLADRLA